MDAIEIRNELKRILTSRCFRSRRVLRNFLAYVVESNLAGHTPSQKEIAIQALRQSIDFNDLENPLVRIQAGRLRKQLDEYYANEGYFNTIRISLPRGGYQAKFTAHLANYPAAYEPQNSSLSLGPNLICIPRDFTVNKAHWEYIACLSRDYVSALSKFSFFQVLFIDETTVQNSSWPQDLAKKHHTDFGLFLDLYKNNTTYDLKTTLVHSVTMEVVWAKSFELGSYYPPPPLRDRVFKQITHEILSYECGIAQNYWARYWLNLNKPIPPQYQTLVMVRPYAWNITAKNFHTTLLVCEERLRIFPNDINALIMSADHCRIEYLLKYNYTTNLEKKLRFSVEQLQKNAPNNAYTYLFTAFLYMIENENEAALQSVEKAQILNPLDTHLNILTGLLYMSLGEWDIGATYVKDCIEISSTYPDWYHVPLSIFYYKKNRYLEAIQEARQIKFQHLWKSILRSSFYGVNNLNEKSLKEYKNLLIDHPDFDRQQIALTHNFTNNAQAVINKIWTHLPQKPVD